MLLIILAVVGVSLLLTGVFVQFLHFLVWVGIVCEAIAMILFIMRSMSGYRHV